ncbi:sinapine esterase-like [Zingiber officinale]|uniref:sinapine esterase-like n=1 Tax=Zingiber officinale TaxID=94328 RepID=UPI001C4B527D|nr:sinapine esterase-like [Zingiber officinale]
MAFVAPPPSPFLAVALLILGGLTTGEGCFSAIFCFGDSITDTGNAVRLGGVGGPGGVSPYGRTFFGRPTGRYTDGRVILDFIAQGFGLPLVRPYLEGGDFRKGANFAVAGATALDLDFFSAKGIDASWTRKSLRVQIEEFKQLLPSLSSGFNRTWGKDILSSWKFSNWMCSSISRCV